MYRPLVVVRTLLVVVRTLVVVVRTLLVVAVVYTIVVVERKPVCRLELQVAGFEAEQQQWRKLGRSAAGDAEHRRLVGRLGGTPEGRERGRDQHHNTVFVPLSIQHKYFAVKIIH